jgi:25S rRNA (uracil2634-N3)-methyltransferase
VLANQLQILRFLVSVAPLLSRGPKPAYASTATAKDRRRKRDAEEADLDFEAPSADEDEAGVSDLSEAEDEAEQALAGSSSSSAIKRPFVAPPRAGSVLITLRNTTPYTLWDVPLLAKRLPLVLPAIAKSAPALPRGQKAPTIADVTATFGARRYALWRSFEFEPDEWPGYEHRRTVGWIDGVSKGANEDLRRRPAPAAPTPPTPGVPGRGKGWKEGKAGGGAAQKERASKAAGGECRTWEFGTESGVHDSASGGGMGGKGVKRRK